MEVQRQNKKPQNDEGIWRSNCMRNKKRKRSKQIVQAGFTLAEVLITLGILGVLLSIGIVSVAAYQKSLKLTEMDAIAKQMFIAAQNQMTASNATAQWESFRSLEEQDESSFDNHSFVFGSSMGNQMPEDYPEEMDWNQGYDYYYIDHLNGRNTDQIFDTILPYGAIDDTIREDGKYVIEYDYKTATVYGVFYTDTKHNVTYEEITQTSGIRTNKTVRKQFKAGVIGYYGGAVLEQLPDNQETNIEIEVKNEDTLRVLVHTEAKASVVVEVEGMESGAKKSFTFGDSAQANVWKTTFGSNTYELILDDISNAGTHFAEIFEAEPLKQRKDDRQTTFIPGEDLSIVGIATSTTKLAPIGKTDPVIVNSLFASRTSNIEQDKIEKNNTATVSIQNIRHLQNLSPEISNLPDDTNQTEVEIVTQAIQTTDLDWKTFLKEQDKKTIYPYHSTSSITQTVEPLTTNQFYPIKNNAITSYRGEREIQQGQSNQTQVVIKNLDIAVRKTDDNKGNSGLFAEIGDSENNPTQQFVVSNLTFDSIQVLSSSNEKNIEGNVGVIVGTVTEQATLQVSDVHVKNAFIYSNGSESNVGAIVGQSESINTSTIQRVQVVDSTIEANASANAGGLVGKMKTGQFSECGIYVSDETESAAQKYEQENKYRIYSAGETAGGLIGRVEGENEDIIAINDTFVAVPVLSNNGGSAGGLIGRSEGKDLTIKNSYVSGHTVEGMYTEHYGISATGQSGVAGGFIGWDNTQMTTIENSYTTVSVSGNTAGGLIGKVESGNKVYKDCYTTGAIQGEQRDPIAVGQGWYTGAQRCYYLQESNDSLNSTVSNTKAVNYEGLKNAEYSEYSEQEVYPYDETLKEVTYPFHLVTNTGTQREGEAGKNVKVHYGDWPKQIEKIEEPEIPEEPEVPSNGVFDIGVLYYEYLEDQDGKADPTFYYHGLGGIQSEDESNEKNYIELKTEKDGLVDGLSRTPDTYVREEGYLILISKKLKLEDLVVKIGTSRWNNDYAGYLKDIVLDKKEIEEQVPKSLQGYNIYKMDDGKLANIESVKQGIAKFTIGLPVDQYNPIWGGLKEKVAFSVGILFGDAVKSVEEPYDNTTYYIRSSRHIQNMKRYDNLVAEEKGQNNVFIQTSDIDVKRIVNGEKKEIETISKFSATYCSELYPKSKEDSYKIVGLHTNLFGTMTGHIERITIKDVVISDKNVVLAEINVGLMENVYIQNVKQRNTDGIQGIVGIVAGTLRNIKIDTIDYNSYGNINVFSSYNNAGTISEIQVSNIKVNLENSDKNINGFIEKNEGTISKISMNNIEVRTNGTVNMFADNNNVSETQKGMFDINLSNIDVISKGKINGFIRYSKGSIRNVTLHNMRLKSDKEVTGFIEDHNNAGTITNIELENSTIESNIEGNGFAKNNAGIIQNVYMNKCSVMANEIATGFAYQVDWGGIVENCYVRSKIENQDGYSECIVKAEQYAVGFSYINQGKIKNSYFVGTVSAQQASGFVYQNTTEIQNCYTNTIVKGKSTAVGFVNTLNNGKIYNSFVVGSITSDGTTAGFALSGSGTIEGQNGICYTALFEMEGNEKYAFAPSQVGGINNNTCRWLEDHVPSLSGNGTAISYNELIVNQKPITHKYRSIGYSNIDMTSIYYPFPVYYKNEGDRLEFWGDWPRNAGDLEVGVVYYEITDTKFYYHGYFTNVYSPNEGIERDFSEISTPKVGSENGLLENGNDAQIKKKGYMIIFPSDRDAKDIQIDNDGKYFGNSTKGLNEIADEVIISSDSIKQQLKQYFPNSKYYDINISDKSPIPNLNSDKTLTLKIKQSVNKWTSFYLNLMERDTIKPKINLETIHYTLIEDTDDILQSTSQNVSNSAIQKNNNSKKQ